MAFDALKTGDFVWQMATPKLPSGRVNDWPQQGVCSTPFIEGDRLYYTSNQAKIVALDVAGLKNGNDGVTDEKKRAPIDGDVIWSYDLMGEADVFPHNLAASSPLVVDGVIYATTGNGVDEGHVNIPSPLAPSFVAIDAEDRKAHLGERRARHQDHPRQLVERGVRNGQRQAAGGLRRRRRLGLRL
jgi:outer membrane protein assembly factor BamB